jgi:capsular polysaccharide biosynthesis protein
LTKDEYISFKHFWKVVKYKKYQILIISVSIALITLIVSLLIPPRYQAETVLMMPETASGESAMSGALGILSPRFSAEKGITSQAIKVMLGSKNCRENIVKKYNLIEVYKSKSMNGAIELLGKRTKIGIFNLTGEFKIQVEDTNPEIAAKIANYYVIMISVMNSKMKITAKYPIIKVIDKATIPTKKAFPKIKLNIVIAFLISTLLISSYYVLSSKT